MNFVKSNIPIDRTYLAVYCVHNCLGFFELNVIRRTHFASTNTVVFYLTAALLALTQLMVELHVKSSGPYFMEVFLFAYVANCFYLLCCLLYSHEKHSAWLCVTFLILMKGICYALRMNFLIVSNRVELIRSLLFVATIAHNFVAFDALLGIVTTRHRLCPPQWIPLISGLLVSLFGGLFHHMSKMTLMAPADALGVAVHLFGFVVELHHAMPRFR